MKQIPRGYPYGGKKVLNPMVELLEMLYRRRMEKVQVGLGE